MLITSLVVCVVLRAGTRKFTRQIALVLHQPRFEIFSMFDNVLLLGKGGRTVYLGPTRDALGYFDRLGFKCPLHVNPADVRSHVFVQHTRILILPTSLFLRCFFI